MAQGNKEYCWFELILTRLQDASKRDSGRCMTEMAGKLDGQL